MTEKDEMGHIKETFLAEAKEILDNLEVDITKLSTELNLDLYNLIYRRIHSIKGSAGLAGFNDVYELTHQLETMMDMLRTEKLVESVDLPDLLINCVDWLKLSIFETTDEKNLDEIKETLLNMILNYISNNGSILSPEEDRAGRIGELKYYDIKISFNEDILKNNSDPLLVIEDLLTLGNVNQFKIEKDTLPELMDMDPLKCYLGFQIILETRKSMKDLREVFIFIESDSKIDIEDVTDEYVEYTKDYDYKEDSKLGEILVDLGYITDGELEDVLAAMDERNKKTGEMMVEKGYATEDQVENALKEQEIQKTKNLKNSVRVDADRLNELMTILGEIVISEASIAGIAEEFTDEKGAVLKNALFGLDRSIREFQEQFLKIQMVSIGPLFKKIQKYARGLSASLNKEIMLEFKGENTELDRSIVESVVYLLKFFTKHIIENNLESADERVKKGKNISGLISYYAYNLEGNFYVDVSDDGVKVNTVSIGDICDDQEEKNIITGNLDKIKGVFECLPSEEGTTYRIKAPLSLAIIEGMLIRVGQEKYIVPLLSIVESLQPRKEDVKTVEGKGEVVQVRGEYVSLIRLYSSFGIEPNYTNPWDGLVMIVEAGGKKVAMMIDDLLGQQQIVIKSIEDDITVNKALSGAAILGDGDVALIIDIQGLIKQMVKA